METLKLETLSIGGSLERDSFLKPNLPRESTPSPAPSCGSSASSTSSAVSSSSSASSCGSTTKSGKLFLGGLSQDTTAADIQAYFKEFGAVKEAFIKMDALTGRSRGFGFVIFVDAATTEAVLGRGPHQLKGEWMLLLWWFLYYCSS